MFVNKKLLLLNYMEMGNTLLIRCLQLQDTKDLIFKKLREFVVRPCLLGLLEATPIKSHPHDCLNQDDTKRLSNMGKNTLSHYPQSSDQPWKDE